MGGAGRGGAEEDGGDKADKVFVNETCSLCAVRLDNLSLLASGEFYGQQLENSWVAGYGVSGWRRYQVLLLMVVVVVVVVAGEGRCSIT